VNGSPMMDNTNVKKVWSF